MSGYESITHTVCAESLKRFLESAERLPSCFRCLHPLTKNEGRAVFAQVLPFKQARTQAIGGVLCEECVGAWNDWRRAGVGRD